MAVINAVLLAWHVLRQEFEPGGVELYARYEGDAVLSSCAGDLHWEVGFGQYDSRMREGEHA